jgi:hypothetical protein
MKIKKLLITSIAITIFDIIVGMACCGGIFLWVYKIEPVNLWRPMDNGPGMFFLIGTLILNLILVFFYGLFKKGIPGKSLVAKGLLFGLFVFLIGMLPGMLATYTFMTVATTVVLYWTILGLVQQPIKGVLIALIYGK